MSRGLACLRENDGFWTLPWLASVLTTRARRPRPFEKTTSRAIPGPSSARPSVPGLPPAEGRAPHARMGTPWLHPGISPLGHRPLDYSSLVTPCPALAYGLAARARRPRPSERITFRVISVRSPLGHLTLDSPSPRRGGLRTPAGNVLARLGACPHWATGRSLAPDDYVVPGHESVLAMRTHRVRPSEKTAFRVMPGFSPLGHPSSDSPPRGGAGSARPYG